MTDDRIKAAQQNIQENLEARPEYVLNTSEFMDVKARLALLENRRLTDRKDSNAPVLRRKPGDSPVDGDSDGKSAKTDQDERPTLKRRN
jgi:hypothetical protein